MELIKHSDSVQDKLVILADAAKYDVACTSSGVDRAGKKGSLGSAVGCGICHSFAADGRCISLLKILLTNICVYDCQYCQNRRSNDVPRAAFTPEEVAELTMNFYRRNYIEGLFLSSAVIKSPDYTTELIYKVLYQMRNVYNFNGYIHVKAIPGADPKLLHMTGLLADRMSVNIELPSENSLALLAPDKKKVDIIKPMRQLKDTIIQTKNEVAVFKSAPNFVPAGQSTQLIVGATPESDKKIITLANGLYKSYSMRRVFYSAYTPINNPKAQLPTIKPPLIREHRLYQADWLMRFYNFKPTEILEEEDENLSLNYDPKCNWAINHLDYFPVEINKADYFTLMRVPGIGQGSAQRILEARRTGSLDFPHLKKMGIVLKRARFFITCNGRMQEKYNISEEYLKFALTENKIDDHYEQLSIFDTVNTNSK